MTLLKLKSLNIEVGFYDFSRQIDVSFSRMFLLRLIKEEFFQGHTNIPEFFKLFVRTQKIHK